MLESKVEEHLVGRVFEEGGFAEKHVTPGRRGVPDRLVTLPWGAMDLVETKRPGAKARANQVKDHEMRAKRGVPVYLLDTIEKVDIYVNSRVKNGRHVPSLFSVPLQNDPDDAAPRCKICKVLLNQPGKPETADCGGDCTRCMADSGDPDCIAALSR